MTRATASTTAVVLSALAILAHDGAVGVDARAQGAAPAVTATRLAQNPLVTRQSSASLGDNINNPTVIRVPSWIQRPLGRYYMYFAHHMGTHIRLAYSD